MTIFAVISFCYFIQERLTTSLVWLKKSLSSSYDSHRSLMKGTERFCYPAIFTPCESVDYPSTVQSSACTLPQYARPHSDTRHQSDSADP